MTVAKHKTTDLVCVEFIQCGPANVTLESEWLSVQCGTLEQAARIETQFHAAGWVARVVAVKRVVSYPTAGAGR